MIVTTRGKADIIHHAKAAAGGRHRSGELCLPALIQLDAIHRLTLITPRVPSSHLVYPPGPAGRPHHQDPSDEHQSIVLSLPGRACPLGANPSSICSHTHPMAQVPVQVGVPGAHLWGSRDHEANTQGGRGVQGDGCHLEEATGWRE
jgi:hypothetical protein